jgi:hypothetical protein
LTNPDCSVSVHPVSERIKSWFVVTLLILAVGGHWAILQSAAYLGMVVSYSKVDSLTVAVSKTLDGRHPCQLCKFVKEGKKAQHHSDQNKTDSKVDFILQLSTAALYPPVVVLNYLPSSSHVRPVRSLPLFQPPRSVIS